MTAKLLSVMVLAGIVAAVVACGGSGSSTPTKPAMRGLLDLGNISFYTKPSPSAIPTNDPSELQPFASSFSGIVINVTWAQLQPVPEAALSENNPIDQALAAVEVYNDMNPGTPLQVKLRVWGGLTAPTWVKAQSVCGGVGGPIAVTYLDQNDNQETGTVGAWWTPEYIEEWRALQTMLAEKYDGKALIHEVAVTSCASSTDEPFIAWSRPYMVDESIETTIHTLQLCGYSDIAQQACLSGAIEDYSAWTQTPIDFPFSIYQVTDADIPPNPKLSTDPAFTVAVMRACARAGSCILSNQALRNPNYSSDQIVYTTMAQLYPLGARFDFQTASPENIRDWCGAVGNGIALHGRSIEMWGDFGGFLTLPDGAAIMANLSNAVLTQSTPAPSPCPPITTPTASPTPTP